MASKYARAVGGAWSTNATWSTTSGGAADTVAPTASDDVFLDASSGNVTIGAAAVALSVNCTGYTGTLTHNAFNLSVSGSVTLVAGMTYSPVETAQIQILATGTLSTGGKLISRFGTGIGGTWTLGDNLSFANFKTCQISVGSGGTLDLNGKVISGNSAINRVLVFSSTVGTSRTVTRGAATFANADFQDITLTASWDASARTDIGDCGGNSGITFPTSVQQTFSGTTSDSWSTNAWTTRVPLPQDDVVISSAFSASQTVTADMPRLGRSIDFTGTTGTPAWSLSTSTKIFGSLTLISGMTVSGSAGLSYCGRGSYTITCAGKTITGNQGFVCPNGTYTFNDAYTTSGLISIGNGGVITNNNAVTCDYFTSNNNNIRSLDLGTSVFTMTNAFAGWDYGSANMTLTASQSTIVQATASSSSRGFNGNGGTYGTFTYSVAGSTGEMNITASNSFAVINFSDITNARTLKFTAGTTTTIRNTNGFNVQGTSGKLMTVTSSITPGGRWGDAVNFSSSAGYSIVDHANFKPSGNFSIGIWFKTSSTTGEQSLFSSYSQNTAVAGIGIDIKNVSGLLSFNSGKNTGTTINTDYKNISNSVNMADGNWHFVVGTWDGSLLHLFVDGVEEGSGVAWANAPVFAATNYVRIGCQNKTGTNVQFYTGAVDDISFWNGKALSQAEVTALYISELRASSVLYADSSLKAYYRFETGALTTDTTANTHTLTAIASPAGTGSGYTITSSNQQSVDYVNLVSSLAPYSPSFYAGANSTDGTGNTGWIFTAVPSANSVSGSNGLRALRNLQNLQRLG